MQLCNIIPFTTLTSEIIDNNMSNSDIFYILESYDHIGYNAMMIFVEKPHMTSILVSGHDEVQTTMFRVLTPSNFWILSDTKGDAYTTVRIPILKWILDTVLNVMRNRLNYLLANKIIENFNNKQITMTKIRKYLKQVITIINELNNNPETYNVYYKFMNMALFYNKSTQYKTIVKYFPDMYV